MATTPDINSLRLAELGLDRPAPEKKSNKALGQKEFFDLMVAQLKFQDPTHPQANTELVSQMAQFSNVESLGGIKNSLSDLAGAFQSSQALQASTLVGRDVLIPAAPVELAGDAALSGSLALDEPARDVSVGVFDRAGQQIARVALGDLPPGPAAFSWDGRLADGSDAPPGTYSVTVDGFVGKARVSLPALIRARVDSVTLSQTGVAGTVLNVRGVGPIAFGDVREVL